MLLHRIRHSFILKAGIAAAALAFGVAVAASLISYYATQSQMKKIRNAELDNRAKIIATHLGNELLNIVENLSATAENTLFANALADSEGRDNYLRPYLHSFHHVGPISVLVLLCDFQGNPLESNLVKPFFQLDREMLKNTVDRGEPQFRLDTLEEDVIFTLSWPVLYANTGLAEGSLTYQFGFDSLARDIFSQEQEENFRILFTDPEGNFRFSSLHGVPPHERALFKKNRVMVPKVLDQWAIIAEVWEGESLLQQELRELIGIYFLMGFVTLLIIIPLSLGGARWLLSRLKSLEIVARNVVETRSMEQRFPQGGGDEIANLGLAFNRMLDDLNTAYQELKSETHREMRSQSERFRRILSATLEGYIRIDLESRFIEEVNDSFCRMMGRDSCSLWEGQPSPPFLENLILGAETEEKITAWAEEREIPGPDGRAIAMLIHCSLDIDESGNRQMVAFLTDISDRKAAEAKMLSINYQLSRTVNALEKRDRELTILNRMNDLLLASQRQAEIYQVIRLTSISLFPGLAGALAILHSETRLLKTVVTWGPGSPIQPEFHIDDCWGMRQGRPHEATHVEEGLLCGHLTKFPRQGSFCLPLVVQGKTLGLLWSEFPQGEDREGMRSLLISLGDAIKLALSNLELREALHEQAIRDPLTKLFNRRYFTEIISREMARAERSQKSLSVAIIDLDHFKSLNDRFGHDAGDRVLVEMGRLLRERVRESDVAFRFGGEEFLLMLPETDIPGALQCLDNLRESLKEMRIHHEGQAIGTVTLSAGIAEYPVHGATHEDLVRAADRALYAAKDSGRDNIQVAG